MTSSSIPCIPYIKGKTEDLSTDEALKILQSADENKCINVPPRNPKDGDIYLYKSKDESVSDGWKHDGYQWRIVLSVNVPRRNPTILKRSYTQLLPNGKEESGLRRNVYNELKDENTEPFLTLLHFQGKSSIEDIESPAVNSPTITKSTPESIAEDCTTDGTEPDKIPDDTEETGGTNTKATDIDSALATLETALQRKTDARPVMNVVNQLVKTVTSSEETTELDYCLVVSDKKSGKSAVISAPDVSSPRRSARKRSIKQVDNDTDESVTKQGLEIDNDGDDKTVDKRLRLDDSSTTELGDQEVLTAKGNVKKIPKPKKEQYFSFSIVSGEEKEINSDIFEGRRDNNKEMYLKIRNCMIQTWQKQKPLYLSISQVKQEMNDIEDDVLIPRLHKYLECKGVINFNAGNVIWSVDSLNCFMK
ncbi:Myb-like [Mactra antiquata]